jgi:hypothetical protein
VTAAGRARRDQPAWDVTYVLAMSVAAFVVSFALYVALRPGNALEHSDVPHYNAYAARVADRELPYRDFQLEYPPAALVMFALPAVSLPGVASADGALWDPPNGAARRYHDRFVLLVLLLGAGMVVSTVLSLAVLRRSTPATLLSLGVVVSSPWLLGDVLLERFDVWPAAATAVAIALALRSRYAYAAGVLAAATAAKFYAVLLLPVLFIVVARHRDVRAAVATAGVALATLFLLVAPFAIASPSGVWDALTIQFEGGLHIETLASAVLVLASHVSGELSSLGLMEPFTLSDREAEHGLGRGVLVGPGTGAAVPILNALLVAAVLGLLTSLAWSKGDLRELLVRHSAAIVAAAVALGSVLSPQYLVWLLPLVVLVGGRRGTAATLLFVLACILTNVWFRWIYPSYARDLDAGTASVLLARNLLLLAIALLLALPARSLFARLRRS